MTFSIIRIFDGEFEGKNIQDITSWQIEECEGKSKKGIKPASVNRELAVLKPLFSKAVEWGKLKESPAGKKVKFFKGTVNRVRFLMPEEF